MIQFTKSYKTDDGKTFGTIEEAQEHDLSLLFKQCSLTSVGSTTDIAKMVLEKKDLIVDILTTTPNSKPKARATHGGTKTRKKTVITDAATTVTGVNTPTSVQGVQGVRV